MKITKQRLREIIKEEFEAVTELEDWERSEKRTAAAIQAASTPEAKADYSQARAGEELDAELLAYKKQGITAEMIKLMSADQKKGFLKQLRATYDEPEYT